MIKNAIALVALGVVGLVTPASASAEPCDQETCTGSLQVPLDWADPTSERIPVPYTWISRTDRSKPSAGVIAGLAGGPGPVGSGREFTDALGPLMADHDLLVVERRGFGSSSPLLCPDIHLDQPETISACATKLGPRAQFFSTDARVADVDAVRQALGVPSLTLYGYSYGTVDAVAYATRYPAHTAAVVADSPLLPGADGYLTDSTYQDFLSDGLGRFGVPCDDSVVCRTAHRDPVRELFDLVRVLRAHPDPAIPLSTVDAMLRYQALPVAGRDTVAAIGSYLKGDQVPLHRLAALLNAVRRGRDEVNQNAAVLTYQCNDMALPYARNASPDVRAQQLADYRQRHPQRPVTATEIGGNFEDFCLNWPTPRPSAPARATYPDVPTLVTGGSLEPLFGGNVVPLAKKFPHGQSLVVPYGSHSASISGSPYPCPQNAVRSFLANPGQPVTAKCTAEQYRAHGTFPLTSAELPRTPIPGVAAAYATVVDVIGMPSGNGLRGGTFTTAQAVTLNDVRYVSDVGVSGQVRFTMEKVDADVTLSTGQRLHLSWTPFQAQDTITVTGSTDGRPFTVCLPTT